MKRDRLITGMIWAASILWMCFCLFLSWQPGEDTITLSRAAAQTVRRVIHVFGVEIDLSTLHTWLRKSAHAVLFFVSGILFFLSFSRSLKGRSRTSMRSLLHSSALCLACAVIAEAGKAWIPGRHLQWSETLLDVAGAVCGAGIAAAAMEAARYIERRRKE